MFDRYLDGRVVVKTGDLTCEDAAAIVNAANHTLLGGGGVDGAIHLRGGPQILHECRHIREKVYPDGLPTGEAVLTNGGELPARYVIHTVGPVYGSNDGRDAELLARSYRSCLRLADTHGLQTVAFPSISTGVFGYPKAEAAGIVSMTLSEYFKKPSQVIEVRLVFFSQADRDVFVENSVFGADSAGNDGALHDAGRRVSRPQV